MTEVDAEQRRRVPWVSSAARRMVPSPPITTASSHSLRRGVVEAHRLDAVAGGQVELLGLVLEHPHDEPVREQ